MGKIKKLASVNIKKITGGRDPVRVIEEFILRLGFDPDLVNKDDGPDVKRWMLVLENDEELELLLEGIKRPNEAVFYMGVNAAVVEIRRAHETLVAALEIADALIGIKVSLVGHYLVLSISLGGSTISVEDLDYFYRLIESQREWFRTSLRQELEGAVTPSAS